MHRMEGNRIVMLDIQKNGSMVERIPGVGQDATTANTLLGRHVPQRQGRNRQRSDGEPSKTTRKQRSHATLTGVRHNGVHYKMVGASGSAKNGKCYFCGCRSRAPARETLRDVAGSCDHLLRYPRLCTQGNPREEADADAVRCSGPEAGNERLPRLDQKESLPEALVFRRAYFYQFRLAFESTQAKGSFKVMNDDVADALGCDLVVPESSIKPGSEETVCTQDPLRFGCTRLSWPDRLRYSGDSLVRLTFRVELHGATARSP